MNQNHKMQSPFSCFLGNPTSSSLKNHSKQPISTKKVNQLQRKKSLSISIKDEDQQDANSRESPKFRMDSRVSPKSPSFGCMTSFSPKEQFLPSGFIPFKNQGKSAKRSQLGKNSDKPKEQVVQGNNSKESTKRLNSFKELSDSSIYFGESSSFYAHSNSLALSSKDPKVLGFFKVGEKADSVSQNPVAKGGHLAILNAFSEKIPFGGSPSVTRGPSKPGSKASLSRQPSKDKETSENEMKQKKHRENIQKQATKSIKSPLNRKISLSPTPEPTEQLPKKAEKSSPKVSSLLNSKPVFAFKREEPKPIPSKSKAETQNEALGFSNDFKCAEHKKSLNHSISASSFSTLESLDECIKELEDFKDFRSISQAKNGSWLFWSIKMHLTCYRDSMEKGLMSHPAPISIRSHVGTDTTDLRTKPEESPKKEKTHRKDKMLFWEMVFMDCRDKNQELNGIPRFVYDSHWSCFGHLPFEEYFSKEMGFFGGQVGHKKDSGFQNTRSNGPQEPQPYFLEKMEGHNITFGTKMTSIFEESPIGNKEGLLFKTVYQQNATMDLEENQVKLNEVVSKEEEGTLDFKYALNLKENGTKSRGEMKEEGLGMNERNEEKQMGFGRNIRTMDFCYE